MTWTSLFRALSYGLLVLHFASAIEFGGYKLYDPANVSTVGLRRQRIGAVYVESAKETQITLPPDSGTPKAFEIEDLYDSGSTRIVRSHAKGNAYGGHLVYAEFNQDTKVDAVYDVPEGKSEGKRILCEEEDIFRKEEKIRCIAIASGWRSPALPATLYVFQHVVHSQLHAFMVKRDNYIFYILRDHDAGALHINFDGDADLNIWYSVNVEFDEGKPRTLSSLSSTATKYGEKFAIIGDFVVKKAQPTSSGSDIGMKALHGFLRLKRSTTADVSKCTKDYVTIGPTRVTFGELVSTIILRRNMDEVYNTTNNDCFLIRSMSPAKQMLPDTMDTPDRVVDNDEIVIYEAKASRAKPFYAVALFYKPDLDDAKHRHHFAMINNVVFHLEDLRHAGEVVYQLDRPMEVVQLCRSTPAIKLTVLDYAYAFKLFPYWMDQSMPHMEYEPLHNYFEAISHGGPLFEPDSVWAEIIITKEHCVITSLLNVSIVNLVGHHQEKREINGTMKTFERDMTRTHEEYEDFHVDQRNPCNDISVLSQIKRTTRKVSKHEEIVLEATDKEPIRVTLNLEEGEKFLLRLSSVEREESKCQDLDTIAIFLKDDMLINEKAYIRTITYEALRNRNKTWVGTGKLTIAIPNGCLRVALVSTYSIQRANNLRILRKCLIVMGLTILMSGTFIFIYYKFSLAGREYRRLRRMYKRAKRNDNFVRHYLKWKDNIEEILTQWEKVADDH